MTISRPSGLIAGYISEAPDQNVPELCHFGEQWAPRRFQIPAHRHEVWELYLQLDGVTVWDVEGDKIELRQDGFLAVRPNALHFLADSPGTKHHFYFLAVDLPTALRRIGLDTKAWDIGPAIVRDGARTLIAPFQALSREITLGMAHRTVGLQYSLGHLMIEANRVVDTSDSPTSLLTTHRAVALACELIAGNPTRNWRIVDLAERADISPSHLAERFRIEVGVTLKQYLIRARVDRAVYWLQVSDVAITDLALELGFASGQHLATVIKARTGKTPTQVRAGDQVHATR